MGLGSRPCPNKAWTGHIFAEVAHVGDPSLYVLLTEGLWYPKKVWEFRLKDYNSSYRAWDFMELGMFQATPLPVVMLVDLLVVGMTTGSWRITLRICPPTLIVYGS